jgi:hypothetical protein
MKSLGMVLKAKRKVILFSRTDLVIRPVFAIAPGVGME